VVIPRFLRILIVSSLLLAFTPLQVIGMPCCHSPAPGGRSAKAVQSCCCPDCKADEENDDPAQDDSPGVPFGCSHCGVEWCCGAGYVPLCVTAASTPIMDRTPEAALAYFTFQPSDGYSPRIEEPPRIA
jgi:hypothetical protein